MPLNTLTRNEHLLILSTMMHCMRESVALNLQIVYKAEAHEKLKEALAKFIIDSREEVK